MTVDEKEYVDPIEAAEAADDNRVARCYDAFMEKYFVVSKRLGLTQALSKEMFYGFCARDIARVHYHKQGFGSGVFFRLHGGSVIDTAACRHDPDPVWYDATTH